MRSRHDAGEMTVDEMFAHMYGSDYFRGQGERDFEDFVREFSKTDLREPDPSMGHTFARPAPAGPGPRPNGMPRSASRNGFH